MLHAIEGHVRCRLVLHLVTKAGNGIGAGAANARVFDQLRSKKTALEPQHFPPTSGVGTRLCGPL